MTIDIVMQIEHFVNFIMDLFNWGIYKSYGRVIYHATVAVYTAALLLSACCLFQVWRRSNWFSLDTSVSLISLLLLATAAHMSISVQRTSAYHQSVTHLVATVVVAGSVMVSVGVLRRYRYKTRHVLYGVSAFCVVMGLVAAFSR